MRNKKHINILLYIVILFLAAGIFQNAFADTVKTKPVKPAASTYKGPVALPAKNGSAIGRNYDLQGSQFQQRTLKNGLKIYCNEKPGCGIINAEVIIKVGCMEEMDTFAGINSVISRMILHGGGEPFFPLQELAEDDGCRISADVDPDYVDISMISAKEDFAKNFKRLARVLEKPSFDKDALEDVKKTLVYIIDNDHSAYNAINELFLQNFYRYHPYRQPARGYKNVIQRLTPEILAEFYKKFYIANRMTVAISGDITNVEALDLAEKTLDNIPKDTISAIDIPWEPVGQEKKLYLVAVSKMTWLFAGFPAPGVKSPDYPKMLLLNSILGEGLSSRLFIELREKEGLSYELMSEYPKLDGPSHLILYIVSSPKNSYPCRKKLFNEINRLKKELVSEEELAANRRKVLGKFLVEKESNEGMASTMAYYASLGLGPDYDDVLLRRMESITPQDIRETAKKYLQNYTILVVESVSKMPDDD